MLSNGIVTGCCNTYQGSAFGIKMFAKKCHLIDDGLKREMEETKKLKALKNVL